MKKINKRSCNNPSIKRFFSPQSSDIPRKKPRKTAEVTNGHTNKYNGVSSDAQDEENCVGEIEKENIPATTVSPCISQIKFNWNNFVQDPGDFSESRYPVTFHTFKTMTHSTTVAKCMLLDIKSATGLDFTDDQLMLDRVLKNYYIQFYENPQIRQVYKLEIKACPVFVKKKIMQIPKVGEEREHTSGIQKESIEQSKKVELVKSAPFEIVSKQKKPELAEAQSSKAQSIAISQQSVQPMESKSPANKLYISMKTLAQSNFLLNHIKQHVQQVEKHQAILERIKSEILQQPKQNQAKPNDLVAQEMSVEELPCPQSQSAMITVTQRLQEAKDLFYREYNKNNTLSYALRFHKGLRRHIIQAILKMSFEEFKKYTRIYDAPEIYLDDELLGGYYDYAIKEPKMWPLNLYIPLKYLFHFIKSKGITFSEQNLEHVSPMLLHWHELSTRTNFDEIMRWDYYRCRGVKFNKHTNLDTYRKAFYEKCWQHNIWLRETPKVLNKLDKNQVMEKQTTLEAEFDGEIVEAQHSSESVTVSQVSNFAGGAPAQGHPGDSSEPNQVSKAAEKVPENVIKVEVRNDESTMDISSGSAEHEGEANANSDTAKARENLEALNINPEVLPEHRQTGEVASHTTAAKITTTEQESVVKLEQNCAREESASLQAASTEMNEEPTKLNENVTNDSEMTAHPAPATMNEDPRELNQNVVTDDSEMTAQPVARTMAEEPRVLNLNAATEDSEMIAQPASATMAEEPRMLNLNAVTESEMIAQPASATMNEEPRKLNQNVITDDSAITVQPCASGAEESTLLEVTADPHENVDSDGGQIVTQPRVQKAIDLYFGEVEKSCTLPYLFRFHSGLKRRIIGAILNMSFAEFQQYTHIYDAPEIHKDLQLLNCCYEYTIKHPRVWPINLFVRVADLFQFLKTKGVILPEIHLKYISPMLLHWQDLIASSNYDYIVIWDYYRCTGKKFNRSNTSLEPYRQKFYEKCWFYDKWILNTPKLLSKVLSDVAIGERPSVAAEDNENTNFERSVVFHAVEREQETCARHEVREPTFTAVTVAATSGLEMPAAVEGSAQEVAANNTRRCKTVDAAIQTSQGLLATYIRSELPVALRDPALVQIPVGPCIPCKDIKEEKLVPLNKLQFNLTQDEEHYECVQAPDEIVDLDTTFQSSQSQESTLLPLSNSENLDSNDGNALVSCGPLDISALRKWPLAAETNESQMPLRQESNELNSQQNQLTEESTILLENESQSQEGTQQQHEEHQQREQSLLAEQCVQTIRTQPTEKTQPPLEQFHAQPQNLCSLQEEQGHGKTAQQESITLIATTNERTSQPLQSEVSPEVEQQPKEQQKTIRNTSELLTQLALQKTTQKEQKAMLKHVKQEKAKNSVQKTQSDIATVATSSHHQKQRSVAQQKMKAEKCTQPEQQAAESRIQRAPQTKEPEKDRQSKQQPLLAAHQNSNQQTVLQSTQHCVQQHMQQTQQDQEIEGQLEALLEERMCMQLLPHQQPATQRPAAAPLPEMTSLHTDISQLTHPINDNLSVQKQLTVEDVNENVQTNAYNKIEIISQQLLRDSTSQQQLALPQLFLQRRHTQVQEQFMLRPSGSVPQNLPTNIPPLVKLSKQPIQTCAVKTKTVKTAKSVATRKTTKHSEFVPQLTHVFQPLPVALNTKKAPSNAAATAIISLPSTSSQSPSNLQQSQLASAVGEQVISASSVTLPPLNTNSLVLTLPPPISSTTENSSNSSYVYTLSGDSTFFNSSELLKVIEHYQLQRSQEQQQQQQQQQQLQLHQQQQSQLLFGQSQLVHLPHSQFEQLQQLEQQQHHPHHHQVELYQHSQIEQQQQQYLQKSSPMVLEANAQQQHQQYQVLPQPLNQPLVYQLLDVTQASRDSGGQQQQQYSQYSQLQEEQSHKPIQWQVQAETTNRMQHSPIPEHSLHPHFATEMSQEHSMEVHNYSMTRSSSSKPYPHNTIEMLQVNVREEHNYSMPPTAQKPFTPLPSPKGTCRMRPQARLKPFLFRILEKLDYFGQVSAVNIAEYQLQCTSIGRPYLQAKIRTSHLRLVVSGDILTELLPRYRPALINDLLLVLQHLGEFHYNTWEQGQQRRLLSKSSHRTIHTLCAQTLLLFLEFSSPFQSKCLDLVNNLGNFPQRNFLSVAAAAREPPSMRATHKFDDLSLAIDSSILEEMAKLKQTL